jgi:hypothetical protein
MTRRTCLAKSRALPLLTVRPSALDATGEKKCILSHTDQVGLMNGPRDAGRKGTAWGMVASAKETRSRSQIEVRSRPVLRFHSAVFEWPPHLAKNASFHHWEDGHRDRMRRASSKARPASCRRQAVQRVRVDRRTALPPQPWFEERRRMMICWADPRKGKTRAYLQRYWECQRAFRIVSVAFRSGTWDAAFPAGAFRPGVNLAVPS